MLTQRTLYIRPTTIWEKTKTNERRYDKYERPSITKDSGSNKQRRLGVRKRDERKMADAEAATAATRASAAVVAAAATGATAERSADTVGSLLAAIATALQDAQRILVFADKRGWGPDEFEQLRTIEDALDEARRDFQALGPLVNGQFYYENDRRGELTLLVHVQTVTVHVLIDLLSRVITRATGIT